MRRGAGRVSERGGGTPSLAARIAHAKAYPFPRHDYCFVYRDGATARLPVGPCDVTGRTPVLAAGSNQSHEQLHRKFGHIAECTIPVWRGILHDFDVVYAAKLTGYGSVPATFQHSPGTSVAVFVQWFTPAQLERMHETEAGYDYDHLSDIRITLDRGGGVTEAHAYTSSTGCLAHAGAPVAIAEIAAEKRRFAALGQIDMLTAVRDRLAPGTALDDFIGAHLDDPELRRSRSAALAEGSLPIRYRRETLARF
jgi:hypothetical protein